MMLVMLPSFSLSMKERTRTDTFKLSLSMRGPLAHTGEPLSSTGDAGAAVTLGFFFGFILGDIAEVEGREPLLVFFICYFYAVLLCQMCYQ
ncbi:hypothetical protein STCU_11870 [Strigomonas culicis]|uniref:Uncharacterized protein n=1 Tax=Strigomonas culicis TaxID=28005 RepID=S9UYP8_9TRYP|nr:hypothetical protein STCU_11870 [Strigomonas culicis]|eukprot:EPY15640.1 hypothetical protein STCU_11870 [Strigomonas culicis]